MTNLKNVMLKVLKKLIFSLFLATLLLSILFQKTKTQIVGMEQGSTSQLIKNLQNQVDLQKTQLDTIKTTLGTLESQIKEQEKSITKTDTQKEFKKQLEENKQELKNAWVSYLSIEPKVTEDQEIVDKFSQAKDATEKHEQEFISKLEVKKAIPTETVQPEEPKPVTEEIKKEEITPESPQVTEVEVKVEEEKIIPVDELISTKPAQEQPKPSEEIPAITPQTEPSSEVLTISKQIAPKKTQEPSLVDPNEQFSEIKPPVPAETSTAEMLSVEKEVESEQQTPLE